MPAVTSEPAWSDAASLAALHAHRTQDELDQSLARGLAALLPDTAAALCLADEVDGSVQVRFTIGAAGPLRGGQRAHPDAWPLPAGQRLPIVYKSHVLGELLLEPPPPSPVRRRLEEVLVHYGTALVNLTLNAEARQATEDYCASLQALEEGIVLFQEEDPGAVTARLLSLASGMVQATAGALYVLGEVGRPESGLRLEQSLGIPESLLASFRGVDGCCWPEVLLDQPVHLAMRAAGTMAMLDPDCVPAVLQGIVVLPLRYHGVQAGVCLLFNPLVESTLPRDVLGRLQSFGQLAAALLHRLSLEALTANSVMLARELEIAETIQKRLQPSAPPATDEYEFAWSTIAAKNIGGDYVDLVAAADGDVHVVVADAAGHGVNSALLMSSFRANYRGNASRLSPPALAATINDEVVREVGPTGMFVTAMLVRLERGTRRLVACSAGHNPTMLYRSATGAVEFLASNGPPLGFVVGAAYDAAATTLAAGDVLLLYTDGVTEATDEQLEMFGEERLVELLRRHAARPAAELLAAIRQALVEFTGRERQDDDVSLIVVRVR